MSDSASCTDCGATYEDWEFDIDRLGYVFVTHVCGPGMRAMYKVPVHVTSLRKLEPKVCKCGRIFLAGKRCHECSRERRRQAVREWYRNRNARGKAS